MNNPNMAKVSNFTQQAMQNRQLMSNQMFNNAVSMYQNHQSQQLLQYAQNLCKEFGIKYEDAVNKVLGM